MQLSRIAAALLAAALLCLPASQASAKVLYVGDSLGVGTTPQLRLPHLDADTRVGRTSAQGLGVLRSRLRRGHRVVVFDLGTNDYSAPKLARNLRRARRISGHRLMIVFTINKPGVGTFNKAIRRFAATAHDVTLVDWHSLAHAKRLLTSDGVHTDLVGYHRRAMLLARTLTRRAGAPAPPGASAPSDPPR